MKTKLILAAALTVVIACASFAYLHRGPKLSETDTVILADFANATGEAVFDGSLREALGVALAQSPFLNLMSEEKINEILREIGRSTDGPLTRDLARATCQHSGSKAYVESRITKYSAGYVVALEVLRCENDARIAATREEAPSQQQVLHALGTAAARLRKELGEEEISIQKFNLPLERATSPSLEALKFYSEGRKLTRIKGALEGVTPLKKAVELDSRFALAYSSLAVNHYNLNQNSLASEEIRQAFEMGDRQTARERLQITTLYYDLGTGDVEKSIASYKEWAQLYPRDDVARGNLSSEFFLIGDYEQAAQTAKEALRLEPESIAWYENASTADIALLRLEEAQSTLNEAFSKKLGDPSLHANIYELAFLRDDSASMAREVAWSRGQAGAEDMMLALQADTEAFYGHLKKARGLSRQAVQSAQNAQLAEPAAIWQALAALREATFGNMYEARQGASEVLKIAPGSRDAQILAALIFARAGDTARSRALLDDIRARYVSNTMVQKAWIPAIEAQSELLGKNPEKAMQLLEIARPYERGQLIGNLSNCCMLPVYLRGEAYLSTGKGMLALAEFQKVLDGKGVVVNCWAGSLARLGLARAQAMAGYSSAARAAYQQFFGLWKDADPDVPILRAARAEYAKLK